MIRLTLVTAAAVALMAGAASAQTQNQTAPQNPSASSQGQNGANSFSDPPLEPPAATSGPMNSNAGAPAQGAPAQTGMQTDVSATEPAAPTKVTVVASSPVPDTAENRAKYGGPDSRGGRRTSARGN